MKDELSTSGMRLTCPHCSLPAIGTLAKLGLGWARQVPCRACGLRITVAPLPAVATMLPCALVVLAVSLRWLRDPATMVLAGVLSFVCMCVLYLWAVPLVKAQLTDASAVARARGNLGQGANPPD
ncbi:hypothetical protein EII20_00665 [Comamonadaceae bacterium OH2545_COT-014]|nr:hypothetical protein EII20_00665 [Comamonadaceae bacterium OH2545_COT-014]